MLYGMALALVLLLMWGPCCADGCCSAPGPVFAKDRKNRIFMISNVRSCEVGSLLWKGTKKLLSFRVHLHSSGQISCRSQAWTWWKVWKECYKQNYHSEVHQWNLNYGSIALMWRGGCIIRSVFLGNIKDAFTKNPQLSNLLLDPYFTKHIGASQGSLRQAVAQAALVGVPTPAFGAALAFYDGYRAGVLPANLLQAQRDYFGAHTYELAAKPGEFIHTNWTGHGGNVSASTYST